MSNRFLHETFKHFVPCDHCPGEIDVQVEGHYFDHNFVIESVTNLHTNGELKLNDKQRALIEEKGDEQYGETVQANADHQVEMMQDR